MDTASTSSQPGPSTAILDRLERLVNNKQFADVSFRVGEAGELMFGHKAILAEASEVFRAQFAELQLNAREQPIPIVDMEPASFMELLRYMYTAAKIIVTEENVVGLYHGANKYSMMDLTIICIDFILGSLSERNVLRVFEDNRRFEDEFINLSCLQIICLNPIKIFADQQFLTLSAKSVELIAMQPRMNCQTNHLLTAIKTWLVANKDKSTEGIKILAIIHKQNRALVCQRVHNFSAGHYVCYATLLKPRSVGQARRGMKIINADVSYILKIDADELFSIHGFGATIKSQRNPETLLILTIKVERTDRNGTQVGNPIELQRTVIAKEDSYVEEILFEKQLIESGVTCTITIKTSSGVVPLFCYKTFTSDQPSLGLRFASSCIPHKMLTTPRRLTRNIVSYVLYNNV